MASIAPITAVLTGPAAPTNTVAAAQPPETAPTPATNAAEAAQAAAQASAQPPDLIFDALALDSAFDETLFTSTAVEGTGAYSAFMGELFAALAAQQTAQEQAAAQANPAPTAANTAPAQAAATAQPAAAAAEFASNAPSVTPNSTLESNVQALANQVQAADSGALSPLQQSFEEFIASAGGSATAASLPNFLQTLANNLHTVPSPLGNLVNSQT
jgi:hypothetical protein